MATAPGQPVLTASSAAPARPGAALPNLGHSAVPDSAVPPFDHGAPPRPAAPPCGPSAGTTESPARRRHVLAYGLFGLPLAFAALPIYVHLPRLYGEFLAIPLAVLGLVLLLARLGDALIDPLLGGFSDHWQNTRPGHGRRGLILLTLPLFALGVWLLLNPPAGAGVGWLAATLALTYLGFSLLTITYQAWGAELAGSTASRSRLTAAREGFGLIGVILAATLPTLLAPELPRGLARLATWFVPLLLFCALVSVFGTRGMGRQTGDGSADAAARVDASPPKATIRAGRRGPVSAPLAATTTTAIWRDLRHTLAHLAFRRLLLVFVLSGIAAALPATLVMFFVADVLGEPGRAGAFLAAYFAAGLCGLPLWVLWAKRRGTLTAWRDGMLLAALSFAAAPLLGAGDGHWFLLICVFSGLALGADLVLPATHLADLAATSPRRTATYFGVWNFATKLNLALAAGVALPLLAGLGYQPGSADPGNNVAALALCYGGLPLLGKLLAAALLQRWRAALAVAPR
ncbi:MAG TPA: MFS transporter [Rhodocyclaceae bacterium]|nr:MFS transporter [Rhodocyclaceae bacterium]